MAVMITTEQWRAAIGCFSCSRLCNSKYVKNTEFCVCNMFVVCLLVYMNTCAIDLNPGPKKNVHNVKSM